MFEQGKGLRKTTRIIKDFLLYSGEICKTYILFVFSPWMHSDLLPTLDWDFITSSCLVATTIIYITKITMILE